MLSYKEIQIDEIKSDVTCKCYMDDTERILLIEIKGTCRDGSKGSIDITKAISFIVPYFFWIEPSALILDITKFQYTFGNSLHKLLNLTDFLGRNDFEKTMPFAIVISDANSKGVFSLINEFEKNVIDKKYFFDIQNAKEIIENQLEP
jgi:hypothetical protein